MKKSFRFLWQFEWTYLVTIAALAAAVTVLSQYSGAGRHENGLSFFQNYFASYALLELLFLFIFSFAIGTAYLNLALSFGARRADYFGSVQLYLLSMTAGAWAVQQVLCRLPALLGWERPDAWELLLTLGHMPFWVFPLAGLAVQAAGVMCGLLMNRHKVLGIVVMTLVMMACIGGVVVLMLTFDITTETGQLNFLGRVPAIVSGFCLVLLGGSEVLLYRYTKSSCVR